MFWLSVLGLLQYACATPAPHPVLSKRVDGIFTLRKAEAGLARRDLNVTDNVFVLKDIKANSPSSRALLVSGAAAGDVEPLSVVEQGGAYGIDVNFGADTFTLIFDTGSSDIWVAQKGFECVQPSGNTVVQVPERQCHFGPLFDGRFTGGKVPNQHFLASYGSGEEVAGVLGFEPVTVGGVTVKKQEFASVQLAYFVGDNVVSGIIGFAYSTLTSAYSGNDITAQTKLMHYTNFIGNAIKQKLIDPSFSVVLERAGGQSQVALGGLPSISFNHDFTTVPLQIVEFSPALPANKYTYYTIDVGGFLLNGKTVGKKEPVIVDTGTTLAYLPAGQADTINAAFDPPAKYNKNLGVYVTSCNATPPKFSVKIGGTNFAINAAEMLLQGSLTGGSCATGITKTPQAPYILGGTFLKNVVAVFDIGAAEMRFAPHVNY